jgi:Mlc titration factor MtfA (ptsG expression regulator)
MQACDHPACAYSEMHLRHSPASKTIPPPTAICDNAAMFGQKHRRRQRVAMRPFPDAWAAILVRNAPFYRRLSPEDQAELRRHVHVFLAEKRFEGCGGLAINDEIRVTIAAHACVLLLHRETDYYPLLTTILVYPHVFPVERHLPGPAGLPIETCQTLAGESWRHGSVVLAWDEVRHSAFDLHDGHNVVVHEFAHQLDEEDGSANGAPSLPRRSMYTAWARILGKEYAELVSAAEEGRPSLLDPYGTTNPAEFFSVATEQFFDAPEEMARQCLELYAELKLYYRQDPAAWTP